MVRYDIADDISTTHSLTWRSNSVSFGAVYGLDRVAAPDGVITNWTYSGSGAPPASAENPRINLWLMNGYSPSNGKEVELIVKRFQFVPLVQQIGPITINGAYEVAWDSVSGAIYQVQWSSNLTQNAWHDLGTRVVGDGATNSVVDPDPRPPVRFYRVVAM
jgi:hypothetical protein